MKNIIHSLLRFSLRLTSYFFFEKIYISGIENLPDSYPVILACNHPNAFLDSIVMTTCVKRPLYYTARGDFFKSKVASSLLHFINIFPVYRKEEGQELIYKNNETFSYSIELFKKNGALVIFPEGLSENKYDLRPLRKGIARLAFEAWNNSEISDKLRIVPIAIHYSSWLKIRPIVYVEFLKNIEKKEFIDLTESGFFNKSFNEKLKMIFSEKCIVVDKTSNTISQNKIISFMLKNYLNATANTKKIQDKYINEVNGKFKSDYNALSDFLTKENVNYDLKREKGIMKFINLISWFIVFGTAFIYNFIPYFIAAFISRKSTKGNDFHDSLLYCVLMFIYPVYLIILFSITTDCVNYKAGLLDVFLTAFSAFYYEAAKRYILTFFKGEKLVIVHDMLKKFFEKGNG